MVRAVRWCDGASDGAEVRRCDSGFDVRTITTTVALSHYRTHPRTIVTSHVAQMGRYAVAADALRYLLKNAQVRSCDSLAAASS